MNVLEFTLVVSAIAACAGFLGALTGLGGGVVITPVLTLVLGVDIRYAIGATLISVIATSSGAAAAYVREGFSNVRIGMFLEIATTGGAIAGALLASRTPTSALAVIFGVVLLYSAWASRRRLPDHIVRKPDPLATRLALNGRYPTSEGWQSYAVARVKTGFGLMFGAGMLSGLLGIGSGALKVLAMDQAMRIPFKVSATTSNFMIGVTAAASAGVYLNRGYVDPGLAMPVTLGVLAGATAGARFLTGARTEWLRRIFAAVVAVLAVQMIYGGLAGKLK
ncbi:MAG: sulfite exporter TauE/SafE family protein [Bryobacteraceae bacterium]